MLNSKYTGWILYNFDTSSFHLSPDIRLSSSKFTSLSINLLHLNEFIITWTLAILQIQTVRYNTLPFCRLCWHDWEICNPYRYAHLLGQADINSVHRKRNCTPTCRFASLFDIMISTSWKWLIVCKKYLRHGTGSGSSARYNYIEYR